MRGKAQRDGRPLGKSKLGSYFSLFMDQSTHGYVKISNDILLHCEDICDKVAKLKPKFWL